MAGDTPGAGVERDPARAAVLASLPDAVDEVAIGFARTLRAAGVPATTDRTQEFVRAVGSLDVRRRADVYWAGRLAFCGSHDDIERYDRVFVAWFGGALGKVRTRQARPSVTVTPVVLDPQAAPADDRGEDDEQPGEAMIANASRSEVLRHRDMASLTAEERAELARLLAAFAMPGETRRTRRHVRARRGTVDQQRTVRALLSAGGEPARLRFRARAQKPRRVVILADVSGSMSGYADGLLRFAHAASRRSDTRTEVFTIGTRLTRVTAAMAHLEPDLAMQAVADTVPDWSGGTRLGDMLKAFLDRWGQRGMARGAVVVVLSDGWERGDVALLGAQMERLSRLAHRVIWANPRAGRAGFAPTAAGMAVSLPWCDALVEGHSMAALEQLARLVAGAAGSNRARFPAHSSSTPDAAGGAFHA